MGDVFHLRSLSEKHNILKNKSRADEPERIPLRTHQESNELKLEVVVFRFCSERPLSMSLENW